MADWPQLDELKQVLDVTNTPDEESEWDGDMDNTRLTRHLAAAIELVKRKVGSWDEYEDEPDEMLAAAALRAAELLAPPQNRSPDSIDTDPIFLGFMYGHRRRFAIS